MSNIGKIYIIENTINNKVYIGQTVTPLETRWRNHLSNARNENHPDNTHMIIYHAMRKYGIENFSIRILEDNISKEKLNERETYWILKYNSIRPNGYNILLGEENPEPFRCKKIYQLDKSTLEIIKEFDSISEAAEELKIPCDYISRVLRGVGITTKGYRWCYQDKYEEYKNNPPINTNGKNYYSKKNYIQHNTTKIILQINPQTNEIVKEWYNGITEAADSVQKTRSAIYDVLIGKRKTCGGYVWKYKDPY